MANIKSAKKRILVTETRAARNKAIRSEVKTSIKKVEAAVAANDKEAAKAALTVAISTIESASSKGIYHKNNSARKVSRLTKLVTVILLIFLIHRNLRPMNQTSRRAGSHCVGDELCREATRRRRGIL